MGLSVAGAAVLVSCSRVGQARGDLTNPDPLVRAAAAESLGVWRTTDVAREIEPLLRDSIPGVRERAAEALGRLGDSTSFGGLVERILTDDDAGVCRSAAHALARFMPDTAVQVLIPYLDGPTARTRLQVAAALTALIRASKDRFSQATGEDLGWTLSGVVESAQGRRAELPGNWRGWDDFVIGTVASEDTLEVVADQAAAALAWFGGMHVGKGLLLALRGTITPTLRDSLLSILVMEEDSVVTGRLIVDCRANIASSRRRALRLLGGLANASVLEALAGATDDPVPDVRREAWRSLVRLHGLQVPGSDETIPSHHFFVSSPELVARARRGLAQDDRVVVMSAALILFRAGDADAVRALVQWAVRRPEWTEDILTLLSGAPKDPSVPLAVVHPVIARGITSANSPVRVGAARALGRWQVQDAAALLVPLFSDPREEVTVAALQATAQAAYADLLPDVLLLFGADSTVQMEAARTAAALVNTQSFDYLLLALTTDQLHRRRAAVKAVAYVAERVHDTDQETAYTLALSRAADWLARMVRDEADPRDRLNALSALRYTRFDGLEEALGICLGDPSEDVRAMAVVAVSKLRPELSIPSLRSIALRGSDTHKLEVVHALGEMTISQAYDILRLVSVVEPSPRIRSAARACLQRSARHPA